MSIWRLFLPTTRKSFYSISTSEPLPEITLYVAHRLWNRMQKTRRSLKSRHLPLMEHYKVAMNFEVLSVRTLKIARVRNCFKWTRLLLLILESEIRMLRIEPTIPS